MEAQTQSFSSSDGGMIGVSKWQEEERLEHYCLYHGQPTIVVENADPGVRLCGFESYHHLSSSF